MHYLHKVQKRNVQWEVVSVRKPACFISETAFRISNKSGTRGSHRNQWRGFNFGL